MIKRIFYLTILVSISLILGACGNKDNVNLSEASSINEDDVTSEYYSEDAYYESVITIMLGYNNLLATTSKQLDNAEKVKSDAEEYLTIAVTERVQPSTSEEYDIDEYFFKFLSNSKSSAEYFIKFANESDKLYLDLANDYMKDAITNIEVTGSILNKYGYE